MHLVRVCARLFVELLSGVRSIGAKRSHALSNKEGALACVGVSRETPFGPLGLHYRVLEGLFNHVLVD